MSNIPDLLHLWSFLLVLWGRWLSKPPLRSVPATVRLRGPAGVERSGMEMGGDKAGTLLFAGGALHGDAVWWDGPRCEMRNRLRSAVLRTRRFYSVTGRFSFVTLHVPTRPFRTEPPPPLLPKLFFGSSTHNIYQRPFPFPLSLFPSPPPTPPSPPPQTRPLTLISYTPFPVQRHSIFSLHSLPILLILHTFDTSHSASFPPSTSFSFSLLPLSFATATATATATPNAPAAHASFPPRCLVIDFDFYVDVPRAGRMRWRWIRGCLKEMGWGGVGVFSVLIPPPIPLLPPFPPSLPSTVPPPSLPSTILRHYPSYLPTSAFHSHSSSSSYSSTNRPPPHASFPPRYLPTDFDFDFHVPRVGRMWWRRIRVCLKGVR